MKGRKLVGSTIFSALLSALAVLAAVPSFAAEADEPPDIADRLIPPFSLKGVKVPEPAGLMLYVKDRAAAIRLGKALFWDMQLGSDGVQACASCHFHAGADNRVVNTINPGCDSVFQSAGPDEAVAEVCFPLHQRQAPADIQASPVVRDINDIIGSQGVTLTQFTDIKPRRAFENGTSVADPVFNRLGVNTRGVTGRNAPSVINAVFNFNNFWDGRADHYFNGVNPSGLADVNAKIFVNSNGTLTRQAIALNNASLASQALGPPLNDVEMSYGGRSFAKLGKKMLSLRPLAQQKVDPADSVLGRFALRKKGLKKATYAQMIKEAFQTQYWDSKQIIKYEAGEPVMGVRPKRPLKTDEFTQMEANFPLFFGLAIQMYEATLVSNDSLFDQVRDGRAAFTAQQQAGLDIFMDQGKCVFCHFGAEFTSASVTNSFFYNNQIHAVIEFMEMGAGPPAIYDTGYYNLAVRPTAEDLGRGGNDPFGHPLAWSRLAGLQALGQLDFPAPVLPKMLPLETRGVDEGAPAPVLPVPVDTPAAVDGSFKTPSLRNVELTGPYFHNGSAATLKQVVEFYTRGGNFPVENIDNMPPFIGEIPFLQANPQGADDLVAFLLTLTDRRVKDESAPFDHPELILPNGTGQTLTLPAVGAGGRPAKGLPPLGTFLGLSPFAL